MSKASIGPGDADPLLMVESMCNTLNFVDVGRAQSILSFVSGELRTYPGHAQPASCVEACAVFRQGATTVG